MCTTCTSYVTTKLSNLKWKTRPKQLLGSLPLAFVLPGYTFTPATLCHTWSSLNLVYDVSPDFGAAWIRRMHLGCSHFRRVQLDRFVWACQAAAQTLFYPKEGAIRVLAVKLHLAKQ